MKEKEIELSTEEIRYLLKGTIHWQDIQEKDKHGVRSSAIPRKQGESVPQKTETESNERSELNRVLLGDKKGMNTHIPEGRMVAFLLAAVGILTITTWGYFVFAG